MPFFSIQRSKYNQHIQRMLQLTLLYCDYNAAQICCELSLLEHDLDWVNNICIAVFVEALSKTIIYLTIFNK